MTDEEIRQSGDRPLPSTMYNMISFVGTIVAAISFGLILFLTVLEAFSDEHKPYVGIITFVILPVFLVLGLALVVAGMVRQHRRRRRGLPVTRHMPHIDLNDPRHRLAFSIFSVGGVLFVALSAFGSFKAYEYTDSDQFCGTVCHGVMDPEYTAYEVSPHARVGCVKCHIGPGTQWFVRAKLSGAYQVYATLLNKYPRPIPTPIKSLRPSRDTCEQCHWPAHFYSENLTTWDYYGEDEENTHRRIQLLMKIGGGNSAYGPTSGIHWHMNIANEVQYIATDEEHLEIPWVQSIDPEGNVTVYRSTESELSEEELATATRRTMDCIDCHNRPTHHYNPPAKLVNTAMALGRIDASLPEIKSVAIEALDEEYETGEEAVEAIATTIREFYAEDYPEVATNQADAVEGAVHELQTLFSTNFFPEMKVSWRNFPDNIGHLYTPGCFRCHDGNHVSDDGKTLSRDCNTCHTIVSQEVPGEEPILSLNGGEFIHPEDIDEAWKEMHCSECHGP